MITFLKHVHCKLCFSRSLHISANSSFCLQILDYYVEKCCSKKQLESLHAQIILQGLTHDTISLGKLISFLALSSSGDLKYAHHLFDTIPQPNRYIYNTLIRAFSNEKLSDNAISLYKKMFCSGILPNEFTFPFALKACAFRKAYLEGISVHLHAIKLGFFESHVVVQNGFINFYVCCGMIGCARKVFDFMVCKNLVTWNSMINGYSKLGLWKEAFVLFDGMREEGIEADGHTFVSLLSLCSRIYNAELGMFVHWYIEINHVSTDIFVQNALLDMYAKCGHLRLAEAIFARIVDKNVVSWTSMVSAYAKHGLTELAKSVFNQMPHKNVVSWNSMISCYLQNDHYKECLELFYKMCDSSVFPDETTVTSVLSACGQLGDLVQGKKLHGYLLANGIKPTVTLFNSLIDMYAKCGSSDMALDIFVNMPEKDIVSWNTVINALALHGSGYRAIGLFQEMEVGGIEPDALTFIGLLSACCHCGLVEIGEFLFYKMHFVYKIPYDIEHYGCMIDIFGRRGLMKEALEVVGKMSMKPDVVIWGTLLGACRIHGNVEIAKLILKQILELDQDSGGLFVLVSNIFCDAEKWDEMKKTRKLMKEYGVRKEDAVSSVEVNGCVFDFMVDDKKHKAYDVIYVMLNQLKDHLASENDAHVMYRLISC